MNTPRFFRPSSLLLALVLAAASAPSSYAMVDQAPPHHPDTAHVFNGCFLSTTAYLTRFANEFPAEQGRPITVKMRVAGGRISPHTMALVSWQGEWWCRDEYFGVFSLQVAVNGAADVAKLAPRAERALARHAEAALRNPAQPTAPAVPSRLTPAQRLAAVTAAAQILPIPSSIYWVRSDAGEVPVVFFRPANGKVAVYDPAHGTGAAECASADDLGVTALVAQSMGYRTETIHRDLPASATLVAAASTSVPVSQ